MRKRDRKALAAYVRAAADQLELRDWDFVCPDETPNDDTAWASCEPIPGQKRAILRFCDEFRHIPLDQQRHVVAHELVHCHTAAVQAQVRVDIEDRLGREADLLFYRAFDRNVEYAVDGLATALAKHLPLIDWPAP